MGWKVILVMFTKIVTFHDYLGWLKFTEFLMLQNYSITAAVAFNTQIVISALQQLLGWIYNQIAHISLLSRVLLCAVYKTYCCGYPGKYLNQIGNYVNHDKRKYEIFISLGKSQNYLRSKSSWVLWFYFSTHLSLQLIIVAA